MSLLRSLPLLPLLFVSRMEEKVVYFPLFYFLDWGGGHLLWVLLWVLLPLVWLAWISLSFLASSLVKLSLQFSLLLNIDINTPYTLFSCKPYQVWPVNMCCGSQLRPEIILYVVAVTYIGARPGYTSCSFYSLKCPHVNLEMLTNLSSLTWCAACRRGRTDFA